MQPHEMLCDCGHALDKEDSGKTPWADPICDIGRMVRDFHSRSLLCEVDAATVESMWGDVHAATGRCQLSPPIAGPPAELSRKPFRSAPYAGRTASRATASIHRRFTLKDV